MGPATVLADLLCAQIPPAALAPAPAGICTECGVCDEGENFGENVVYEPPPIPAFEGHYRPNSTKAQRLRFRWAVLTVVKMLFTALH